MNKAAFSFRPGVVTIILIFILFSLIPRQNTLADAAPPPDPTVGGVGPYQPQKTNVQMMSETVLIDVPPSPANPADLKQIKVNASFIMQNQGQTDEQMQVIFPLTRLNTFSSGEALYEIDISSFTAKVNGQPVPFTTITTPPEVTISDMEHGFYPDVQWAAFEVTFPVHQDVILQVEYEMLNPYGEYGEGFTGIAYILETGAGWYGNILSADITLRLSYPATEESIRQANPGYTLSGNEIRWKLKNFEPARKENLEVAVMHVDSWTTILELRSKVDENPDDVDSWGKLANLYWPLSIYYPFGYGNSLVYGLDDHFAALSLEARQKIVDLRPEWGDAHFRLAEILWYTNPKVKELFRYPGNVKGSISKDDPSIQGVLHELDLAWSYGVSEDIFYNFVYFMNSAVTDLELTPPARATATAIPITETFTPVPINTTLPTASPALAPTVSPTLITTISQTPFPTKAILQIPYAVLITIAVGLIIVAGIFVYRWKSKS